MNRYVCVLPSSLLNWILVYPTVLFETAMTFEYVYNQNTTFIMRYPLNENILQIKNF